MWNIYVLHPFNGTAKLVCSARSAADAYDFCVGYEFSPMMDYPLRIDTGDGCLRRFSELFSASALMAA